MSTLQDFVTMAAVSAGLGPAADLNRVMETLDGYVAEFALSDHQAALNSAKEGLTRLSLDGSVRDALTIEIDRRLQGLRHAEAGK